MTKKGLRSTLGFILLLAAFLFVFYFFVSLFIYNYAHPDKSTMRVFLEWRVIRQCHRSNPTLTLRQVAGVVRSLSAPVKKKRGTPYLNSHGWNPIRYVKNPHYKGV